MEPKATSIRKDRRTAVKNDDSKTGAEGPPDDIHVTVTLVTARKPAQFDFPEETPLSAVKAQAMDEFGVEEGPTPDGQGQVVYQIFDKTQELTDLTRTIGAIAAPGRHAKLNLVKQIIQGS